MNMNRINFDSIVHRDAYRNGFDVYEQTDDLEAMLSSTFHKGEVMVSYREDEGYDARCRPAVKGYDDEHEADFA